MKCFIIMPVTTPVHLVKQPGGDEDHFAHVLEYLFVPAIEKAGLEVIVYLVDASTTIVVTTSQEI